MLALSTLNDLSLDLSVLICGKRISHLVLALLLGMLEENEREETVPDSCPICETLHLTLSSPEGASQRRGRWGMIVLLAKIRRLRPQEDKVLCSKLFKYGGARTGLLNMT